MDTLTLRNVEDTVDHIRKLGLRGDFNEAHSLIQALDTSVACLPAVTYACASFYMTFNRPKLAEECLQIANHESLLSDQNALLDESAAAISLLGARIKIRRYFEYSKAFALAKAVEDIYVNLQTPNPIETCQRTQYGRIHSQSTLWTLNKPELYDDAVAPISDMRVFLEVELFELMSLGVSFGFMSYEEETIKLQARIAPLVMFLRAHKRHYLEDICFFVSDLDRISPSSISGTDFILSYLNNIHVEEEPIRKAVALSHMAQYQMQSDPSLARRTFDAGVSLFYNQKCANRLVDCDFVRIRDFESNQPREERLEQLYGLVNRCCALGNTRTHILAIHLIIQIVSNDPGTLWPKAESVIQLFEDDLETEGDMFQLLVIRVTKWKMVAWHLQEAESSRQLLHQTLENDAALLTPDLYASVCEALYRCYTTLGDFTASSLYAEMEVASDIANSRQSRKSDAEEHLANARQTQLVRLLELLGSDAKNSEKRRQLIDSLIEVTRRLEQWALWDLENGRKEARQIKITTLVVCYHNLNHKFCPGQGYDERLKFWVQERQPKGDAQPDSATVYARVLELLALKKYLEAYEYAEQASRNLLTNTSFNNHIRTSNRLIVVLTMQAAYPIIKAESPERAKLWRERQYKWLVEDNELLYSDRSTEILLHRVSILCWVARDYLDFFPENRKQCLEFMAQYFSITDKMCYDLRHSLNNDAGINQLLRRRTINSKFTVRSFYEHAPEFFLKVDDETSAWYWMQRKRGQALLDLIAERAPAHAQLQSVLENSLEIGPLLMKEDNLINEASNANMESLPIVKEDLRQLRDKMKKVPTLNSLMEHIAYPKPDEWDELNDVWSLANYLPQGANIVLVDWFVAPENDIYWMCKNLKEKDLTPRYQRLKIKPWEIDQWITRWLRFPDDGSSPLLQSRPKAAWWLQGLVDGLEKLCDPDDLVVLTPPAKLSALPIHAIPIGGKPWLERNPIVYSSSFSLYRECLKRSQVASQSSSKPVFVGVYEEPNQETEWEFIREQIRHSASLLGGNEILGTDLTKEAMKQALVSSPWIHYHGHAYYDHLEPLQQCFILSNGKKHNERHANIEDENQSETPIPGLQEMHIGEDIDLKNLEVLEMPVSEEAMISSEKVLSSYLLRTSSQLTVADIFGLNLAENHPFVCNIACDSGLQHFDPGDEPLGLVTALFCAGASSVLGTLWPIQSEMGRQFTRYFYESIDKQIKSQDFEKNEGVVVLNLAFATRDAALRVKAGRNNPYSWAGFVLHGAGFIRLKFS